MVDWDKIRANKISPEQPNGWPADVRAISQEGLTLLGIHEKTGRLYWDGKEVVTRTELLLGRVGAFAVSAAAVAATAASVTAVVNLIRLLMGK